MPSSPLASLMRQIETDLRSPLAPQAPLTPPRFDAEQYFAEGGPAEVEPEPRPLTIYRGDRPQVIAEPETDLYPSMEERPIPLPPRRPERPVLTPQTMAARMVPPELQAPIGGQQVASPSMEGFGRGLTTVAEGAGPLTRMVGEYAKSRLLDPTQIPGDIGTAGSALYGAATEDPIGFVGGMLPVIGNIQSADSVAKLDAAVAKAEAEGNFALADKLKGLSTLAAAGVVMPVGGGAAAKAAARAGERAALEGVEKAVEGGVKQAISSADTSIKQVPALFKSKYFDAPKGSRNLDIGGGKYDLGSDYLRNERGVESQVYDPFNRSSEHNEMVLNAFRDNPADTVTAANVLNVIAEPEARAEVIQQAFDNLKPGGKAHFDVYEGDRSGAGRETSKGWQNNMKAQDFLEEVRSVFPDAERKGTTIIATKPAVEGVELGAAPAMQVVKQPPRAAEYIEPGSFMHSYTEPESGAYMNVVTRPTGPRSASVVDLYVPEEYRGTGVAKFLQSKVMEDFPSLAGQVSSRAAATNAYKAGRRMAGNETASLDDIFKKIDEDSSVNMWTPKAAVDNAATTPTLYRPVVEAYQEMPEPVALRTSTVDYITESINASDGAKAQLPTKQGLGPMYIVDSGAEGVSKKSGFMLNDTKNANAARQLDGINPLFQQFPDMGTNPEQWAQGMSKAFGSKEVVAPPYRFMKALESGEYTDLLKTLTPGQIVDADAGFAAGKDFLRAYHAGEMGVEDTGKLFMWGIMSRGVNPFTHEGLFLDAFQGIEPYIKMAADGKFTKEVANGPYKEWAATTAGKGSGQPGAGAMHNLNAFGKDFLVKMGRPGADGVTPMQKLHDLMSDPDMTGRDIRREFAKVGEGVGIDNKVVSFILLATGRDDVMVIDRIQLKNLWDDGRYADVNIWDGISVPTVKMKDGTTKRFPPTDEGRAAAKDFAKQNKGAKGGTAAVTGSSLAEATYGAKGILIYEALEDALMKNVGKMYQDLGRPEAASPGRFHWETWVARSNQEASHGTLPAILKKVQGSNNPLEGVYSKQGDYQSYAYGAKYGRSAEGQPQFTIPLSTGEEIVMSPEQYSAALDLIRKPKSGVIPSGKGQKFNVTDTVGMPWYEREGVNRAKLDDIIRQAAAGQAGVIRKADGGSVSDRSGSGTGGRGTGGAGKRGDAFNTVEEQVTAVASDLANIARKDNLDQRHVAYLLKVASGMYMPPERAMEFAGQIMLGDAEALISRFKTYRPSIRTFARLNQMMGGKHKFMRGNHMGANMMRMKGEEALMKTKENLEGAMDSEIVRSRPAMKKALEAAKKRM